MAWAPSSPILHFVRSILVIAELTFSASARASRGQAGTWMIVHVESWSRLKKLLYLSTLVSVNRALQSLCNLAESFFEQSFRKRAWAPPTPMSHSLRLMLVGAELTCNASARASQTALVGT